MPVTLKCRQCGASVVVPPSRASRRKFCSKKCQGAWLSENNRGDVHPMKGRKHRPESIAKMREAQLAKERIGPANPNWKGSFLSRGYRYISQPGGKAILEHRLVMEQVLGRPLEATEVVHHINGVKTDNRPENLEIHGNRTHKMTHAELYRELRDLRALAAKCSCGTFPHPG